MNNVLYQSEGFTPNGDIFFLGAWVDGVGMGLEILPPPCEPGPGFLEKPTFLEKVMSKKSPDGADRSVLEKRHISAEDGREFFIR